MTAFGFDLDFSEFFLLKMQEILPCESVSNCGTTISSVGQENKRQKSIVWEHFSVSESDTKKAICKHCPRHKNKYAYSNGGTKNLMNHLKSQHSAKITDGKSMTCFKEKSRIILR